MRLCSVDGCNEKHEAKGYCKRHYQQWKKHGRIVRIESRKGQNSFIEYDDYIEIILRDESENEIARTKIDKDDFERVINKCVWRYNKGYVRNAKCGYLHRFILGCNDENKQIDHINRDKLDNRKSNLRVCTCSDNMCNRTLKNKSGVKNVYLTRNNTYQVRISKDGKTVCKNFETLDEAKQWRDCKLKELHGEYFCKEE